MITTSRSLATRSRTEASFCRKLVYVVSVTELPLNLLYRNPVLIQARGLARPLCSFRQSIHRVCNNFARIME
jgi:hypothetical protein